MQRFHPQAVFAGRMGAASLQPSAGVQAPPMSSIGDRFELLAIGRTALGRGTRGAVSAPVARLTAFAAGLGRELRVLRKAALLVRHALTAFAARYGCKLSILRKTALGSGDALAAFAARLGCELAVLREAALLIGHCLAPHARDLPLTLLVHRGKSTI